MNFTFNASSRRNRLAKPVRKQPPAPVKTQAAPVKTQAAPVKTQAASVKTQAAPVKTQAAPVKTAQWVSIKKSKKIVFN